MTAPLAPSLGDAPAKLLHDPTAVLTAHDAIERAWFEVGGRVRPAAPLCLRLATRLIRFAGQNVSVRLNEVQRRRTTALIGRTRCPAQTAAHIDQCLRSATVGQMARAKPNRKGA